MWSQLFFFYTVGATELCGVCFFLHWMSHSNLSKRTGLIIYSEWLIRTMGDLFSEGTQKHPCNLFGERNPVNQNPTFFPLMRCDDFIWASTSGASLIRVIKKTINQRHDSGRECPPTKWMADGSLVSLPDSAQILLGSIILIIFNQLPVRNPRKLNPTM